MATANIIEVLSCLSTGFVMLRSYEENDYEYKT